MARLPLFEFFIFSFFIHAVTANFHITDVVTHQFCSDGTDVIVDDSRLAVPSNYFNCKAFSFFTRDRSVEVGRSDYDHGWFQLKAGLCGMGGMDFYHNSNTGTWDFYVSGGDGTLQGSCYGNKARDMCWDWWDGLSTASYLE